jgi:hypothetical protein
MVNKLDKNKIIWFVAIIFINGLWAVISDNEVSQSINRSGADFSEQRDVVIGGVLGDSSIPVRLECNFIPMEETVSEIGWDLTKDGEIIASWRGTIGDSCDGWQGELNPGDYVVNTISSSSVEATVVLYLSPFKAIQVTGHLLFTLTFFLIVGIEIIGKKYWSKQKKSKSDSDSKVVFEQAPAFDEEGIWQDPIKPI